MKKGKSYGYNELMREAREKAWAAGVTTQEEFMKIVYEVFQNANKKA